MMREAADIMIRSGMADVGYEYVNIDDCWMNAAPDAKRQSDPLRVGPFRDAAGNLIPNKHFPDMKGLADYIHSKGLKAGLYTSPGPKTCAGFAGAYQHEAQDAKLFADWGFDFLKYDWCSYGGIAPKPPSLDDMKKPYILMGGLLQQQSRDMVLNLCQYGMGEVWKWGAEVGGQSWRTAGDLGFELDRIFEVALKNCEHRDYQKPGAWNDPDYIQIGYIGNARGGGLPAPCPLTPTEQYSFMSLWALMASPIFYSGDMSKLDEFTLNVLCNPEVIEINQDPRGQCARVVKLDDDTFLMVKDLANGAKAVGLCNRGEDAVGVTARWNDIGVKGRQPIRDVWRQKDLGKFTGEFKADVPRRGVVLVKLGRK
jgi:alpha-galactosidase